VNVCAVSGAGVGVGLGVAVAVGAGVGLETMGLIGLTRIGLIGIICVCSGREGVMAVGVGCIKWKKSLKLGPMNARAGRTRISRSNAIVSFCMTPLCAIIIARGGL